LKGRIAARMSVKRFIRQNLGVKAPHGLGPLTDPRKAIHNRICRRRTVDVFQALGKLFR